MVLAEQDVGSSFFHSTLPAIIAMALELPLLFQDSLPLLLPDRNPDSIGLTRRQLASLLANIFLCTFERSHPSVVAGTGGSGRHREAAHLSSIDCFYLFGCDKERNEHIESNSAEKLKCLLHYFSKSGMRRDAVYAVGEQAEDEVGGERFFKHLEQFMFAAGNLPAWFAEDVECESKNRDDCVYFIRRGSDAAKMDWRASDACVSSINVCVSSRGTIQDVEVGVWEADFANANVGGGVLSRGCVQEEIRFLISPELIGAKIFTGRLEDHESLLITGSE